MADSASSCSCSAVSAGLADSSTHLLVAALVGAVAHAERPHAALAVGHQLDLDVARGARPGAPSARSGRRTPARPRRGRARRGWRPRPRTSTRRMPRPPPPAAALIISGKPSSSAMRSASSTLSTAPAAPRGDGHAGLLGQLLGLDLVAQRAHVVGLGADEDDPQPVAQLGERGVLGDEAPADPGGVRARSRSARARAARSRGRRSLPSSARRPSPGRGSGARRPGARTARGARSPCRAR